MRENRKQFCCQMKSGRVPLSSNFQYLNLGLPLCLIQVLDFVALIKFQL